MTKQEFEQRINARIPDDQYKAIEFVYNFHPCIDGIEGKDQIAYLYLTFGMRIIFDMMATAKKAKKLEEEIKSVNNQLFNLKREYSELQCPSSRSI